MGKSSSGLYWSTYGLVLPSRDCSAGCMFHTCKKTDRAVYARPVGKRHSTALLAQAASAFQQMNAETIQRGGRQQPEGDRGPDMNGGNTEDAGTGSVDQVEDGGGQGH